MLDYYSNVFQFYLDTLHYYYSKKNVVRLTRFFGFT